MSDCETSRIGTRMSGREPSTYTLRERGRGWTAASSTWAEAAMNFGLAFMKAPSGAATEREALGPRSLRRHDPGQVQRDSLTGRRPGPLRSDIKRYRKGARRANGGRAQSAPLDVVISRSYSYRHKDRPCPVPRDISTGPARRRAGAAARARLRRPHHPPGLRRRGREHRHVPLPLPHPRGLPARGDAERLRGDVLAAHAARSRRRRPPPRTCAPRCASSAASCRPTARCSRGSWPTPSAETRSPATSCATTFPATCASSWGSSQPARRRGSSGPWPRCRRSHSARGRSAWPILVGGAIADADTLPPEFREELRSAILTEAALDERIDLALAALAAPGAKPKRKGEDAMKTRRLLVIALARRRRLRLAEERHAAGLCRGRIRARGRAVRGNARAARRAARQQRAGRRAALRARGRERVGRAPRGRGPPGERPGAAGEPAQGAAPDRDRRRARAARPGAGRRRLLGRRAEAPGGPRSPRASRPASSSRKRARRWRATGRGSRSSRRSSRPPSWPPAPTRSAPREAQASAAKAALDQADWRLKQRTAVSTVSGVVTDTLFVRGEWVGRRAARGHAAAAREPEGALLRARAAAGRGEARAARGAALRRLRAIPSAPPSPSSRRRPSTRRRSSTAARAAPSSSSWSRRGPRPPTRRA